MIVNNPVEMQRYMKVGIQLWTGRVTCGEKIEIDCTSRLQVACHGSKVTQGTGLAGLDK
jgi:hypothetical protein